MKYDSIPDRVLELQSRSPGPTHLREVEEVVSFPKSRVVKSFSGQMIKKGL